MKRTIGFLVVIGLVALISVSSRTFSQGQSELANPHKIIHRLQNDNDEDKNKDAHGPDGEAGNAKTSGSNGIVYHGGPLILGTTNVYYIWYGNWSGNTASTILTNLAQHLGGSPYFNINTTYYNGSNVHVSNSVNYVTSTNDSYSHGTSLSDSAIQAVVSSALTSGHLPYDTNAVYFVLTSADVTASSGFCTQYCGWHTHGTINGFDVKYAFIGNPDRCPSACEAQTTGPNGNAGADGMASIISHELEEAVTDPDLNAWYDRRGAENADKCAWTFGTTYTTGNGALANMNLGGRDYLIQRNWVNASGGFCAKSYP
jgi:Phosphate-induced protein 1 conserved region